MARARACCFVSERCATVADLQREQAAVDKRLIAAKSLGQGGIACEGGEGLSKSQWLVRFTLNSRCDCCSAAVPQNGRSVPLTALSNCSKAHTLRAHPGFS
jgi:hypothetical protein